MGLELLLPVLESHSSSDLVRVAGIRLDMGRWVDDGRDEEELVLVDCTCSRVEAAEGDSGSRVGFCWVGESMVAMVDVDGQGQDDEVF